MDHKIMVWDKPYMVTAHQKSKSVWVASGNYEGHDITVQDRTERTALGRWREAARYRGG